MIFKFKKRTKIEMSLENTIVNLLNNPDDNLMNEWHTNIKNKLPKETNISLSNICKAIKLKKSGKKEELVNRIIECVEGSSKKNNLTVDCVTYSPKKVNIIDKIQTTIRAVKNENNNFKIENTDLIISPSTKLIIGHEVNGQINNLTEEEVMKCQELRLNYDVSNIKPNTGLTYLISEDDIIESEEED